MLRREICFAKAIPFNVLKVHQTSTIWRNKKRMKDGECVIRYACFKAYLSMIMGHLCRPGLHFRLFGLH